MITFKVVTTIYSMNTIIPIVLAEDLDDITERERERERERDEEREWGRAMTSRNNIKQSLP